MPKTNIAAFAPDSPVNERKDMLAATPSFNIDEDWLTGKDFGKPPSTLEQNFAVKWVQLYPGIDLYTEAQLIPDRKYRWDFVHYAAKVAIEVNGHRDHSSRKGVQRDNVKTRLLQAKGWLVFPLTADDTQDEHVLESIAQAIKERVKP